MCYQVRHPRGALIEEDRQERSSSICYQVDTHGVHLKKKVVKDAPLLHIIMLDTNGVHLKKKIVKNTHLLHIIMLDTHRVHLKKKVVKDTPLLHIIM
jgi:hypothetical protein